MITSRGKRKPANADDGADEVTRTSLLGAAIGQRNTAPRGNQPDIVGFGPRGNLVVGIEVKLRSNLNWQRKADKSQLDVYALSAPKRARLYLLVSDIEHRARVERRMAVNGYHPVESRARWRFLSLRDLEIALDAVAPERHSASASLQAVERLVTATGRVVPR